ncbi:MAG: hypothetical protein R2789_02985 [Microthrixaceae bacterium]
MTGVPRVLQATMNRTQIQAAMAEQAVAMAEQAADGVDPGALDDFGKPEVELTHGVDVSDQLRLKRRALAAHASQISDDSWFLKLDDEMFARAFGIEWFIESGRPRVGGEELRGLVW